jgi:hypothetical protein
MLDLSPPYQGGIKGGVLYAIRDARNVIADIGRIVDDWRPMGQLKAAFLIGNTLCGFSYRERIIKYNNL